MKLKEHEMIFHRSGEVDLSKCPDYKVIKNADYDDVDEDVVPCSNRECKNLIRRVQFDSEGIVIEVLNGKADDLVDPSLCCLKTAVNLLEGEYYRNLEKQEKELKAAIAEKEKELKKLRKLIGGKK